MLVVIDDRDLTYEKEIHQSTLSGYRAKLEQSNINQIMAASPQEYLEQVNRELTSSQARYQAAKTLADGKRSLYHEGVIPEVEWKRAGRLSKS